MITKSFLSFQTEIVYIKNKDEYMIFIFFTHALAWCKVTVLQPPYFQVTKLFCFFEKEYHMQLCEEWKPREMEVWAKSKPLLFKLLKCIFYFLPHIKTHSQTHLANSHMMPSFLFWKVQLDEWHSFSVYSLLFSLFFINTMHIFHSYFSSMYL